LKQVSIKHGPSGSGGIVISALRGGSGKTVLSIGLIAAFRNLRKTVAPFKKGPDYIDAGWLTLAAGRPCHNLDSFLSDPAQILHSYRFHTASADLAVIEGNRGLYDAIDTVGETSTAELAKLLNLPIILCLDCTKTTRTMAAVVSGCDMFDPDLNIKGVILNRVAGSRHENILRKSIEEHCGIPVLGAVPKLKKQRFPERHMGLVPTAEHDWAKAAVDAIAEVAEKYLDLDALVKAAEVPAAQRRTPSHDAGGAKRAESGKGETNSAADPATYSGQRTPPAGDPRPRIGILRDSAFQFYYPENIQALAAAGAEIVFTSPLSGDPLPVVDGLYIGGGFPETHARELSENVKYRNGIRDLVETGLPIYAECGGLMYLGKELRLEDRPYPMAAVFSFVFGFSKKPQGHGYTVVVVEGENPFYQAGTVFKGHEFHYSHVLKWDHNDQSLVFGMKRGNGIINQRDGACYKNVLATYTHIHALGLPQWAEAMVRNARIFREQK